MRWEERTTFFLAVSIKVPIQGICASQHEVVSTEFLLVCIGYLGCHDVPHLYFIYHAPVFVHPCNSRKAAIHLHNISTSILSLTHHGDLLRVVYQTLIPCIIRIVKQPSSLILEHFICRCDSQAQLLSPISTKMEYDHLVQC